MQYPKSLRDRLATLRLAGIEMVMAEPISLDPDGEYIIAGVDGPVKGKDIIGYQSAFTRKTQELAEERRRLAATEADLAQAAALVNAFDADPFGTLEKVKGNIVAQARRAGMQIPPQFEDVDDKSFRSQFDDDDDDAGKGGDSMSVEAMSMLKQVAERLSAIEQNFEGYKGGQNAKDAISRLEQLDPDRMKDPEFRKKLAATAGTVPVADVEVLYKLAKVDDVDSKLAEAQKTIESLKRTQTLLGGGPQLGFSSGSSSGSSTDENDALRSIFEKNLLA